MLLKKPRLKSLLFILLPLVLGAVAAGAFVNAGNWLLYSDPVPSRLDLVFTFASENPRVAYSRELMHVYPGAHWVLSDYRNGHSRLLRRDGYDMQRVDIIDTCSSTISEVRALKGWIASQTVPLDTSTRKIRPLEIGLISSPYHMRRIKLMVKHEFKSGNVRFHYLPVPLERYNWNRRLFARWWREPSVRGVVMNELKKMAFFWVFVE